MTGTTLGSALGAFRELWLQIMLLAPSKYPSKECFSIFLAQLLQCQGLKATVFNLFLSWSYLILAGLWETAVAAATTGCRLASTRLLKTK